MRVKGEIAKLPPVVFFVSKALLSLLGCQIPTPASLAGDRTLKPSGATMASVVGGILNTVVTPLIRWPIKVLRAPVRLVHVLIVGRPRRSYRLPVSGLQETRAQTILFALRRAATTREASAQRGEGHAN